ncbi:XDH [Mytilus edulis]|uniref:XDH n=1 Tax=Mytilus edulis TaxID=6550 RepID=A0A8S3SFQ4_MYTED|nr:XDH [Mytilus edulis]
MCHEGGCGICMVEAKLYEPMSDTRKSYPINSVSIENAHNANVPNCLCPLFMCDGWEITTIEGISDVIPKRLAKYNGSQCGYCSPGQVMNMHALLDLNQGQVTMKQVEDAYDNVICRCTGYRPILDAMKSFAQDSPTMKKASTIDIEVTLALDILNSSNLSSYKSKVLFNTYQPWPELGRAFCSKTGKRCQGKCHPRAGQQLQVVGTDSVWYRPDTFDQLFKILADNSGKKTRMVFGNTGQGVYYKDLNMASFDVLIDIRGIQGLYSVNFDPTIVLGAGLSINQLIDVFTRSQQEPSLGYLVHIRDMLKRVAGTSVRTNSSGSNTIPISQFLKTDMTNKVIVAMEVPAMTNDYMNSHSYINAGIRMKIANPKVMVAEKPCIVFSGIAKNFVHAVQTETYLQGKSLADINVIQGALTTLASELNPDPKIDAVEPSVGYRKNVAIGYLYSFILEAVGDTAGAIYKSGAMPLLRPLSSGQQSYDTKPMEWPLTEPLIKLEAIDQCTGKAEYINDIPEYKDTLYAAFVTSTVGNAKLQSMDPSKALSIPGVLKFITAKDIPGKNDCVALVPGIPTSPEEILCGGDVMYAGQALAIIVAVDEETANRAAAQVQVTYSDQKTPILSIDDGIKQGSFIPSIITKPLIKGDAQTAITNSTKQITGTISFGEQQHFQMETQISYCRPTAEGMNVEAATQWLDNTQKAVSNVLGVPISRVNVTVKRLGGAYGSKLTRSAIVAAGCALTAHIMNRPVKLNLEFHTNMRMVGRRFAYRADYTVGCTDQGKLNGIKMTVYSDSGYLGNEDPLNGVFGHIDNGYFCDNWNVTPKTVRTNKPVNTFCRAPDSAPGIFIIESVMEHISKELNLDPTSVRVLNLYNKGQTTPSNRPLPYCNIRQLTTDLMTSAGVTQRQDSIKAFNKVNRWKKKGLSVVPAKFGIGYAYIHYNAIVNIYAWDGSISIAHGGIEMGQGINTKINLIPVVRKLQNNVYSSVLKVAQVCAFELGVPLDVITVKSVTTTSNANDFASGGSTTSELCCLAVLNCCQALKARMAPVKAKMKNPTWPQLAQMCQHAKVDLSERYCVYEPGKTEDEPQYNSYGVTCTEVEFDVLTGQYLINRVDLLYDCGESMNPMIDVGQVEGAFVMGLGYWLTEQVKFDPQSGRLLTDSTWEYKPPMAKDIPIDFRIQLLKNAPNPKGVLRSKAVGEPPLCMSTSALFALKRCVEAARRDIQRDSFFPLDGPASVDKLCELCLTDPSQFVI